MIHPGVLATVQDGGRPGHRGLGVPVGGAFDRGSLALANALVGNGPDAAALELTLVGGEYRARIDLALALAGAPMAARVVAPSGPDRVLAIPQSFTLRAGERLVLGGSPVGARAYLAVRGGWRTPVVLGSRSAETGITAGSILPAEPGSIPDRRPAWSIPIEPDRPIRVVDGPDGSSGLGGFRFTVSNRANRMGLRLDGPDPGLPVLPDRPSMPVAPGAIQAAGGRLIVLGVAGGTMGGYPHVAHVISADLDRLSQLRPGSVVEFRRVTLDAARQADLEARHALRAALAPVRWLARFASEG